MEFIRLRYTGKTNTKLLHNHYYYVNATSIYDDPDGTTYCAVYENKDITSIVGEFDYTLFTGRQNSAKEVLHV